MQVILLEKVHNLGNLGDVVSWRWKNARVPVRRAGVILPFSLMKSRRVSMSL